MLDLPGVSGGGTSGKSNVEQERPYLAASSGRDRPYKVGRLKSCGAGRESERSIGPLKACRTTRWREGTSLGSSWEGSGMRKRSGPLSSRVWRGFWRKFGGVHWVNGSKIGPSRIPRLQQRGL
jgi:hypothetical protein